MRTVAVAVEGEVIRRRCSQFSRDLSNIIRDDARAIARR
jgi:hypothetical protein